MRRCIGIAPGIVGLVIALISLASPSRANAQGVVGTWNCGSSSQCATVMGAARGERSFSSVEACNAWGQANIPGGYECSGGGQNRSGGLSLKGSPPKVVVAAMLFGAPLGCGLGSLAKDVNGGQHCVAGGLGGLGALTAAGAFANPGWSAPVKAVVAAAGCGAMGAAAATYQQHQEITGSAESETAKKNVPKYAGIAAGACGVLGFIPDSEMRFFRAITAVLRPSRRIALMQRGRHLGANIEW